MALMFPAVYSIPVIGYLAQVGALFSIMLFSFRKMNLFLVTGAIGSLLIASFLFGFKPMLLTIWGSVVLPAIVLGRLMAVGSSTRRAFATALLFSVTISLILFLIERGVIFAAIDNFKEWILFAISNLDVSEGMKVQLIDSSATLLATVKRLIPSLLALSGVVQLFLGWAILFLVIKWLGEFFPSFGDFVHWKMPSYYIYITGLFIVGRLVGTEIMQIVSDNIILFIGFFYVVFGFSVIEYYLKKIRLSLFLRVLFYTGFIFLQLPGLVLAAMIGVFDSYFDFRRVRARMIG